MEDPRFMVMQERLVVHLPGGHSSPGPDWAPINCATKSSYGCGNLANTMLQGLTLYLRRRRRRIGDDSDLNSSLSIGLTHLALESIQDELGVPSKFHGIHGCLPEVDGSIRIADHGVLVLYLIFRRRNHGKRMYYLVYDTHDASIYMVPYISPDLEALFTVTPVPVRRLDGHELVLMARKLWPQRTERGRLCVFSPATRTSNPDPESTADPWKRKVHCFPNLRQAFSADVTFSSDDKVFWCDLSQGVAYSDLRDGNDDDSAAVFIQLPRGYLIDFSVVPMYDQAEPADMSRTMGCVEGSVKFVCICRGDGERHCRHGNETVVVKVWSLDLDHKLWKEDKGFPCLWKDLWKEACHMDAELRDVLCPEPQYPVLTSDGALSVLLPSMLLRRRCCKEADYICSFDIVTKRCLCFGRVSHYHCIGPLILPYNFFIPLERKLPTHKRKLSSIVRQVPRRRPAFLQ